MDWWIALVVYLGGLVASEASICQPDWSLHDGNCYKLFDEVTEGIITARKVCKENGAHLAIPDDQSDVDFLLTLMDGTEFYFIGINDNAVEGVWSSFEDCEIHFLPWRWGEPNNYETENIVILDDGGEYRDVPGFTWPWTWNYSVKYFCEQRNENEQDIGSGSTIQNPTDNMTRSGYFSTIKARFLFGHNYTSTKASHYFLCAAECMEDKAICLSYNYNIRTKVCILNEGNHHDTEHGFLPNPQSTEVIADIDLWIYSYVSTDCA